MKKVKLGPSLRALKIRAWCMKTLSELVPLRRLRRGYLKAYYRVWEEEHVEHTPDPNDVYVNGLEWSRRPLPTKEAARLLTLHDEAIEHDLDFSKLLEDHLHHP
jgi:hypothetical protein